MGKRRYTLKKRAEQQEETRARIVEAAIELHEKIGPANTTISAIAERAGVERLTVYRHFPDDETLFGACSSTYIGRNPIPDSSQWSSSKQPEDRTRTALTVLYEYYRSTSRMWARVTRDQDQVPALEPAMTGVAGHLDQIRDDLVRTWKPAPSKRRAFDAIIGHATEFATWHSFDRLGLDDQSMAETITLWCKALRSSRKAPFASGK